jgi:hypothetical protein
MELITTIRPDSVRFEATLRVLFVATKLVGRATG